MLIDDHVTFWFPFTKTKNGIDGMAYSPNRMGFYGIFCDIAKYGNRRRRVK